MKKITSLFISLLLAVSISSLHADHHAKSPEQQIQAALKAGKISKEDVGDELHRCTGSREYFSIRKTYFLQG